MSIFDYEVRFHELSWYVLSSIPTKFERTTFLKGISEVPLGGHTFLVLIGGTF